MPRIQVKNFDSPDNVRTLPLVRIETVNLGEMEVGHCHFEPGWRWSTTMAELLGTTSCPIRHVGYTISGSVRVRSDAGEETDIGPDTVFDIPPGHDKWVLGDEPWVALDWGGSSGRAVREALHVAPGRALATILFTDIVDSTGRLARIGDAAWGEQLSAHRVHLREELNVFRGREIQTTGDGFLATFDSPARAVRAAAAMVASSDATGLSIRAAAHTGEVEFVGDDVRGIAVHVAARILALAGPGEVLVSSTTADLLEGSGFELVDAGTHELKGVPGRRQVFRLARQS